MYQPKWFRSKYDSKDGVLVLFLKQDSTVNKIYQYGIVKSVDKSRDGVIRKVRVKYPNANEGTDREKYRAACQLVIIHPVNKLDIIHNPNNIGIKTKIKMIISNSKQRLDDYDYER